MRVENIPSILNDAKKANHLKPIAPFAQLAIASLSDIQTLACQELNVVVTPLLSELRGTANTPPSEQ